MRVLFRCDAGSGIGGGHVMRCLTLAGAVRQAGGTGVFLCSEESLRTVPELHRSGFTVIALPERDGATLHELLPAHLPFDGVVVDHYGLDAEAETEFRQFARTVVVIDDLARPHDCDLLLDQTFGRAPGDYLGLVPAHARTLVGAAYALLRPSFALLRETSLERRRNGSGLGRVLVAAGMSDVGELSCALAEAICARLPEVAVDVVVGATASGLEALQGLAAVRDGLEVHIATPHMAELMNRADLAVGAAGTSTWERCCLGLPTLMLVLADNQKLIAAQLAAHGAAEPADPASPAGIAERIAQLRHDPERMRNMAERAAAVTDGSGCQLVVSALAQALASPVSPHGQPIAARRADARDRFDIWLWRNHKTARGYSANEAPIPFAAHAAWWARRMVDPDCDLVVLFQGSRSIGQVRFDAERNDEGEAAAVVSIALAPEFHGQGLGAPCLSKAIAFFYGELRRNGPLHAMIRRDNNASRRIFERCGFEPAGSSGGFDRYRRTHGDQEARRDKA